MDDNAYASPQHPTAPLPRPTWTIADLIRVNARAVIIGAFAGIVLTAVLLALLAVAFVYWLIRFAPTG